MNGDASARDRAHMAVALGLARRGLGRVWPNPAVGCVLVRDGIVVGRGWTQPGGRPHAETRALAQAGARARGACAYVTLEPCSHHGQTPPCAEALIAAGVARVVVALTDPDPRVAGRGIAALRAAGITVAEGVGRAEAAAINAGFLSRIAQARPLLTLKLATTLDGRSALADGTSQWITGPAARAHGQMLRATHDAILIGAATAAADNPQLTCRLPGLAGCSPVRVVLDRAAALAADLALFTTARQIPSWWVVGPEVEAARTARHTTQGVRVLRAPVGTDGFDLTAALTMLGDAGLTRVLVESGGRLAGALLAAGLVDRLMWYRAAALIGADGRAAVGPLAVGRLADCPRFERLSVRRLGDDMVEEYIVKD